LHLEKLKVAFGEVEEEDLEKLRVDFRVRVGGGGYLGLRSTSWGGQGLIFKLEEDDLERLRNDSLSLKGKIWRG
jgi:hypothetical protein